MNVKIKKTDGTMLKQGDVPDHSGISIKQLLPLREVALNESISNFNNTIGRQAEQWSALSDDISESIEAGKEDMIRRQAEANAEAYAKALRSSPFLFDEIVGALSSLCSNRHYNSTSDEDTMNDYVRDILGQGLQVRDQTRQGISGNSRYAEKGHAGEVDIQIRNNGRPIGIYEGLRLESVTEKIIHEHIAKATVNYNPQGVKEVFVVAYVIKRSTGFGSFWKRFVACIRQYKADSPEHQVIWDDEAEETGLSAVRSIHGTYYIDDEEHSVHVLAVKIMA